MARRGSLIAVRQIDDTRGTGAPQCPVGWDVQAEDNFWFTLWPLGRAASPDVFFHARLMVRQTGTTPNRGAYVCVGTPAVMSAVAASSILSWATLQALRDDMTAPAVTVKNAWRDERPTGDAGSVVRFFARMAGFFDDDGE